MAFNGQGAVQGAVSGAGAGSSLGPWGAVGGAIIGGALGGFKTKDNSSAKALHSQYLYNKKLMEMQNDMNIYNYQHQTQWKVADNLAAGVHPWYGIANGSVQGVSGSSVGMPDMVGEKKNRQDAIIQGLQLVQDWSAKQAEIKMKEQQVKTEFYNTQYRRLEVIEKQLTNKSLPKKIKLELEKEQSEIIKNLAEARKIKEETEKTIRSNKFHKEHPNISAIATAGEELKGLSESLNNAGSTISNFLPWKKEKNKKNNNNNNNKSQKNSAKKVKK